MLTKRVVALAGILALAASSVFAAPAASADAFVTERIRKELLKLPYYGVFDYLTFEFNDGTVILHGDVVRPTTRSAAANRVKRIKGVEKVVNKIDILPLSSHDDAIRARTYRAVFGAGSLYRYALGANPSIHIVVNRGHITLEGVVSHKMDKQLAYMAANGVSGVFSVNNNLRVTREG